MQRRSRLQFRVRYDSRELRLDFGVVSFQEEVQPARDLPVAVPLAIAVVPVEIALRLKASPAIADLAVQAVARFRIAGAVVEL